MQSFHFKWIALILLATCLGTGIGTATSPMHAASAAAGTKLSFQGAPIPLPANNPFVLGGLNDAGVVIGTYLPQSGTPWAPFAYNGTFHTLNLPATAPGGGQVIRINSGNLLAATECTKGAPGHTYCMPFAGSLNLNTSKPSVTWAQLAPPSGAWSVQNYGQTAGISSSGSVAGSVITAGQASAMIWTHSKGKYAKGEKLSLPTKQQAPYASSSQGVAVDVRNDVLGTVSGQHKVKGQTAYDLYGAIWTPTSKGYKPIILTGCAGTSNENAMVRDMTSGSDGKGQFITVVGTCLTPGAFGVNVMPCTWIIRLKSGQPVDATSGKPITQTKPPIELGAYTGGYGSAGVQSVQHKTGAKVWGAGTMPAGKTVPALYQSQGEIWTGPSKADAMNISPLVNTYDVSAVDCVNASDEMVGVGNLKGVSQAQMIPLFLKPA